MNLAKDFYCKPYKHCDSLFIELYFSLIYRNHTKLTIFKFKKYFSLHSYIFADVDMNFKIGQLPDDEEEAAVKLYQIYIIIMHKVFL